MEPKRLNWPGGEHDFQLRIGELEALDDLTPEGVLDLRYRLSLGQSRGSLAYSPVKVREILATVRLGLIGGGMERSEAERKVNDAFGRCDVSELIVLAYTIISAAFAGKAHDQVGKKRAAENPRGLSSPKSTAPARQSASRQAKSSG